MTIIKMDIFDEWAESFGDPRPLSPPVPPAGDNSGFELDIHDYCSTFADDSLNLFQDCDFGFDASDFSLPELDFGDTSASALDLGVNPDFDRYPCKGFQRDVYRAPSHLVIPGDLSETQESTQLEQVEQAADRSSQLTTVTSNELGHDSRRGSTLLESEDGSSKRARWNDSMIVFSINSGKMVEQRRRKPFKPSRKKEVALNRAVGACLLCKLKKGSCNFGIPCDNCMKRAGSLALGQEICIRKSLVSTRFDLVDLFATTELNLRAHNFGLLSITGSQRYVYIWYPTLFQGNRDKIHLKLPIVDFKHTAYSTTQFLVHITYYGFEVFSVSNKECAISWESLSVYEEFVCSEVISELQLFTGITPFDGLQNAVLNFAKCYINHAKDLVLQMFLRKILRMQYLFEMYHDTPTMASSPTSEKTDFVSRAMNLQLRTVISKIIVKLEVEILSEMDRIPRGTGTVDRRSPLVFCICLWVLIFSYKREMVRYKVPYYYTKKYSLSQHLYNAVTSIYAALYKTTSPLTLDWRTEEVASMLGEDPELIRLFCDIKTEMYWFYAERDRLLPEDNLFKTLVLENENRLLESHKKAARRQGLL